MKVFSSEPIIRMGPQHQTKNIFLSKLQVHVEYILYIHKFKKILLALNTVHCILYTQKCEKIENNFFFGLKISLVLEICSSKILLLSVVLMVEVMDLFSGKVCCRDNNVIIYIVLFQDD